MPGEGGLGAVGDVGTDAAIADGCAGGCVRELQTCKHEANHALLRRVRGGSVGGLDQKDHWLLHQPSRTWAQPGTHKLGARS